ncbi:MAG: non-ribosomal peptide synthetase, partial [bacterium]|nr:non-ribosomal peptide synthetase [bacterium]
HRNAVNVLHWFGNRYGVDTDTHVLQLTEYSFDPSIEDIFGSLIHGAVIYTGSNQLVYDRRLFCDFVDKHRVNIVNFVPLMLKELLYHERKLKSMRVVISGGDRLDDSLKDDILSGGYNLYNNYGPTEITVDALSERCTVGRGSLGRPVANTRCYILDKAERVAPLGATGELCIAGAGVTRGYLNNPELTNEKYKTLHHFPKAEVLRSFSQNTHGMTRPPGEPSATRLYKTGDLCRWLEDGRIEFLGRMDHQVKIRGFRIELGEIESRLLMHTEVNEVVVLAHTETTGQGTPETSGDKYICAYFVPVNAETLVNLSETLREFAGQVLPTYMIPSYFIAVDSIPRTVTGKVNAKVLPRPREVRGKGSDFTAPRDQVEKKLAVIWEEVLFGEEGGNASLGIDNNFFEMGGHSLKAITLLAKIK